MGDSVATLSHTYAVFMLVWLFIDYVRVERYVTRPY